MATYSYTCGMHGKKRQGGHPSRPFLLLMQSETQIFAVPFCHTRF